MSIGKRLKEARKEARLTQRELGGERYSPSYICQLEKDKIRPSVKALEFLGGRLGKTVSYFFSGPEQLHELSQQEHDTNNFYFLLNLGESYLASGRNALAQKVLDEANAINLALDKHILKADLLRYSGRLKTTLHQEDEAEENLLEALSIFKELGAQEELAKTYLNLAQLYFYQQSYGQAKSFIRKAAKITRTEKINDPALEIDILRCSGVLHGVVGESNQAVGDFEKALELCSRISDSEKLAELYLDLGLGFKDKRELEKAIEYSKKALDVFESLQNKRRTADVLVNLGITFRETGKYKKALELLTRSEQLFSELGDIKGYGAALTELAQTYLALKKLDLAEKKGKSALALAEEFTDEVEKARVLSTLAEIAYEKDDLLVANNYYQESIKMLQEHNVNLDLFKTLRKYSQLLLESGETKKAGKYLQEALSQLNQAFPNK